MPMYVCIGLKLIVFVCPVCVLQLQLQAYSSFVVLCLSLSLVLKLAG